MQRRSAITLFAALALAACSRAWDAAPRVEVEDAIVTLPAAAGRPGAAYFRLETNVAARLTSVTSPRVGRIELHEAGMRRTEAIALSPNEALVFEPGGRHAMLFGLDASLRAGERIALTFRFEGAPPVAATAEIRRAGDVHSGH